MFYKIRLPNGVQEDVDLAKSADVCELRNAVLALMPGDVKKEELMMIVNGRILEDKNTNGQSIKLYSDYGLTGNEVIQVSIRPSASAPEDSKSVSPSKISSDSNDLQFLPNDNPAGESPEELAENEPIDSEVHVEEGSPNIPENQSTSDEVPEECPECHNKPDVHCDTCGCVVCGSTKDEDKTLLCEGYEEDGLCNAAYHTYCLDPPLEELPDGEWFCPDCELKAENRRQNTVVPGRNVTKTKKASQPSAKTSRKWGGGRSCDSVQNKRTDIGSHFRGTVPGVHVGQSWLHRVDVSADRIHCPTVAGIHGALNSGGAVSIVVSGGYEDDLDKGEELTYTGEGGRCFEGNKRSSEQTCDQLLTKGNEGLASTCYGNEKPSKNGGGAGVNWRKSKPVRVIRGSSKKKSKKTKPDHSKYEPQLGYRYDGLYKVVKYYQTTGKSGFKVWNFLLRRDDPAPAPWTPEGKQRIAELELKMKYPKGYDPETGGKIGQTKKRKSTNEKENEGTSSPDSSPPIKKVKFELESNILELIETDLANSIHWNVVKDAMEKGFLAVVDALESEFKCPICQDRCTEPITLMCKHNLCKDCLQATINMAGANCPTCRAEIEGNFKTYIINSVLQQAMDQISKIN